MTIQDLRKKVLNKPQRKALVKISQPTTANTTHYYSFRTSHSIS